MGGNNQTLIGIREFHNNSGEEAFKVKYFRVEKASCKVSERIYGVSLEKFLLGDRKTNDIFEEFLTEDRAHIDDILDKLIGCSVTPGEASEVIDYIYDKTLSVSAI